MKTFREYLEEKDPALLAEVSKKLSWGQLGGAWAGLLGAGAAGTWAASSLAGGDKPAPAADPPAIVRPADQQAVAPEDDPNHKLHWTPPHLRTPDLKRKMRKT